MTRSSFFKSLCALAVAPIAILSAKGNPKGSYTQKEPYATEWVKEHSIPPEICFEKSVGEVYRMKARNIYFKFKQSGAQIDMAEIDPKYTYVPLDWKMVRERLNDKHKAILDKIMQEWTPKINQP